MRLPPYSTRAANPQSMVSVGDLPKESYRMVTRFGVPATAMCASSRMKTAKARKEMCRILVPPWCSVLFLIDVARIGPPYGEYEIFASCIFRVWSVHSCEFPILCRKVGQRQASAALLNVDSRPAQSKPGSAIRDKWSANRSYPETG